MAEPALPWAHPAAETETEQSEAQKEEEPGSTQDDNNKFLTLDTAGIVVGGRMEVKWQVEPDEGEAYYRWWGATVVGPSEQQDVERPEAPVYELLYDAHDDFEQDRSHVVLTSEHTLHQLDQTDELTWRREGDTWDDNDDEDDDSEDAEEDANGEALLTMDDLKQMGDQELGGRKLEDVEQEVLESLEPSKRIAMAAGFRDFADNLISFLRQRVSADGGDTVVTEEHVKSFTEAMLKKQRTR